ncbi:MAG: hypothetical protein WC242_00960 [Candidatus Paceibacterota bacterium]|jgi:hypothetical protein
MKKVFVLLFSFIGLLSCSCVLANPIVLDNSYIGPQTSLFHIEKFGVTLLVALLLELSILWLFGFRKKKEILFIIIANAISVALLYVFLANMGYHEASAKSASYIWRMLFFPELIIVCFESIFLKIALKKVSFKKLILAILIANIISATFGTALIELLPPYPVKFIEDWNYPSLSK